MQCAVCGAPHDQDDTFCVQCGAVRGSEAPPELLPTRGGQLDVGVLLANRYRILRRIAKGGFSVVYLAEDTHLDNQAVAVKEMVIGAHGTDPLAVHQIVADFQQEALILRRITHPNLPHVIDRFEVEGRHYLVMDYVEGRTLRAVLTTDGPQGERTVLAWAAQLCAVLHVLHTQPTPIIYRDLKPENVMVQADGTIKLIDFGIARFYKIGQTLDTTLMGTSGYAAPEQYGPGQSDARTDVYSLGVLLYELLTGYDVARTPFHLPPVRQRNTRITRRTERALRKATQPNPNARFPDIQQFARALAVPSGAPATVQGVHSGLSSLLSRWRWPIMALVALVVMTGGTFAWQQIRGVPPSIAQTASGAGESSPSSSSQGSVFANATARPSAVMLVTPNSPPASSMPTTFPAPTNSASARSTPVSASTSLPQAMPTSQSPAISAIGRDGQVYLGDALILDTSEEAPGCSGVGEIGYSPTRAHFLVILTCFEGDNEAFLFRADGSDKRRLTGNWDYLNYFDYSWLPDGQAFDYRRINSCCATPPSDAPPAGLVRYDVASHEKTLITPEAQDRALYRVVNVQADDVLNVRSGPGVTYPLVGTIPTAATGIRTTGAGLQEGDMLWVPVRYGDIGGWVNRYFLAEESSSPSPGATVPPASSTYRVVGVASDDVLNVRSGAGVEYPLAGTIPPNGTDIEITGPGVEEGVIHWVPIRYQGVIGWVNRDFLAEQ